MTFLFASIIFSQSLHRAAHELARARSIDAGDGAVDFTEKCGAVECCLCARSLQLIILKMLCNSNLCDLQCNTRGVKTLLLLASLLCSTWQKQK